MYTREASTLDLFTDSIRIMGDATMCAVLVFDTRIDPEILGQSANACLLANPVLHSRLVRGNGPAYWEMALPPPPAPVRVEACPEYYHPSVSGPIDPYGPVQFRVRILRRPSGDIIVLNLAHAAADGFGLHALCDQMLQEYENPGSIPPQDGGIPERDTLWTHLLVPDVRQIPGPLQVIDPLWPDPFGTSSAPSSFHRFSLGPDVLGAIRSNARSLGGSLNDAMLAAYFLAMSDLTCHRGPIETFFPVNLRQHLKDGSRVMSNQAVNVSITLEREAGDEMETVLQRVIGQTRTLKAGGIGIAEQVRMDQSSDPEGKVIQRMVGKMAALQQSGLADIFITNPGPITLPPATGLNDAYICYPGGYMPTTCFVTSTFRGRMTVTMGYQNSTRPREGTRAAMQLFGHYLVSLVDGYPAEPVFLFS